MYIIPLKAQLIVSSIQCISLKIISCVIFYTLLVVICDKKCCFCSSFGLTNSIWSKMKTMYALHSKYIIFVMNCANCGRCIFLMSLNDVFLFYDSYYHDVCAHIVTLLFSILFNDALLSYFYRILPKCCWYLPAQLTINYIGRLYNMFCCDWPLQRTLQYVPSQCIFTPFFTCFNATETCDIFTLQFAPKLAQLVLMFHISFLDKYHFRREECDYLAAFYGDYYYSEIAGLRSFIFMLLC